MRYQSLPIPAHCCPTILRVIRLAAVSILLVSSLSAQDCLTRKLPINISNKDWQRVSGIPAENIQGTYRGKAITVVDLKTDYSPKRRVLLLLDTSGSMQPDRSEKLDTFMNLVVTDFVAMLPVETSLGVGEFGSTIKLPADLKSSRTQVDEVVRSIMARQQAFGGTTRLFAALRASASLFQPVQPGDSIVVVTDGGDNASKDLETLAKEFERSRLRLFAFILSDERRATPEELAGPPRLAELVHRTGGFLVWLPRTRLLVPKKTDEIISSAVAALVSRILYMQELTVRLPEASAKTEKLKLKLIGLDPKDIKKLHLEYPTVLQPCKASTFAASAQP